jgi:hypothetical protein
MSDQLEELEKKLAEAKTEKDEINAKLALAHYHMNDDFIEEYRLGQESLELAKVLIEKESEAFAHEIIAGCLWKL